MGAWTGSGVAWTSPGGAWTGPGGAWTGPGGAWTGPRGAGNEEQKGVGPGAGKLCHEKGTRPGVSI